MVGTTEETLRAAGPAAAPALLLASDMAAAGAARARRRLGCAGTGDAGLEGAAAGRGRSNIVREVELALLRRGRGMVFVAVLLPFEGCLAAAGAVDGRGGGSSS
jgi:hypothetical protein